MEKKLTDALIVFFPYLKDQKFGYSETSMRSRVSVKYANREYSATFNHEDKSLIIGNIQVLHVFSAERLAALKLFVE